MSPIQPSLRGSLLTGASALALFASGSGADAQYALPYEPPVGLPAWTVWVEGDWFQTRGGAFNVPTLPGLGAPFTPVGPSPGIGGAFGFDVRLPDPVWHFVFDFRYGKSRTATNSSSSSSSTSTTTQIFSVLGFVPVSTIVTTTNTSSSTQVSEWESHAVADFMVGHDVGMGRTPIEVEFGIRVADLYLGARANETASTTGTTKRTFKCDTTFGRDPTCVSTTPLGSTSTTTFASWNSRFFGAGPRLAVTQDIPFHDIIPFIGYWSVDYEVGVAELIGERSFNLTLVSSSGTTASSTSSLAGVFNMDAWGSLGYALTPNLKLSGGLRADFYGAALTTYNINTGGLTNLDRLFWGPFVRLTGAF